MSEREFILEQLQNWGEREQIALRSLTVARQRVAEYTAQLQIIDRALMGLPERHLTLVQTEKPNP